MQEVDAFTQDTFPALAELEASLSLAWWVELLENSPPPQLPSPPLVFAGGLPLGQSPSGPICICVGTLPALQPHGPASLQFPSQGPLALVSGSLNKPGTSLPDFNNSSVYSFNILGVLTCLPHSLSLDLCGSVLPSSLISSASVQLRYIKNSFCVRQLC